MSFLKLLEGLRCEFLDTVFLIITSLGEETAFLAISIFIFWCVSKKEGYYVLSVGFIGTVINQFLKLIFRIPRPWVLDKDFVPVKDAIKEATGYSFPSGHTQNSVGTFGSVALFTKKNWVRIASVILCVLIPFSRMYLGVHTPLDVFVSVGIAILLIFVLRPVMNSVYKSSKNMYIFLGFMTLLSLSYLLFVELYPFPEDVDMNNYHSGLKNGYTLFGALLGMLISYPIESKYIKFDTEGKWYTQIFKAVIGLGLVLLLKSVLKYPLEAFLPADTVARAIRYCIIVIFAVVIYPISFKYFKLLENKIKKK